ncbi:MAG TPA: monovalent cation/H+ antiporter complex subunit F [Phycisphaerales bacterium]|nr:monovalent cation/H+ antiporter complex subunit F [Phycisphaerales bacterium]HMP36898.1 monovalent cation/H+ antiporter complex subunit F [Phycisphaerales bacterium]
MTPLLASFLRIAPGEKFVTWWALFCGVCLGVAFLVAGWRAVRGPSLADRIVALDLLGFLTVSLAGLIAIVSGRAEMLGVGLAGALVLFLGTVAFAVHLERRGRP